MLLLGSYRLRFGPNIIPSLTCEYADPQTVLWKFCRQHKMGDDENTVRDPNCLFKESQNNNFI